LKAGGELLMKNLLRIIFLIAIIAGLIYILKYFSSPKTLDVANIEHPLDVTYAENLYTPPEAVYTERILDVPHIDQNELYPTGCESVSAVMALNYLGVDITVDDFIDNYLDIGEPPDYYDYISDNYYGASPWRVYIGDPYSYEGFGCYAPVIVNAVKKFIDNSKFKVNAIYDEDIAKLCRNYINNGIPVILWATIDMEPPYSEDFWIDEDTGEMIDWVIPQHCLLLVGYDSYFYYFNDPLQSEMCRYAKKEVEAAYAGMYRQAVVIRRVD